METINKLPALTIGQSVSSVFKNMLNFNGRARRSELWWYWMIYAVVSLVINQITGNAIVVSTIIGTLLQLTLWAVTVRRLHDRGHSGWWVTVSILVGVFSQFYMIGIGYYDIITAVNPDIDEIKNIFTNPVFTISALVSFVVNVTIFVFCVLDGKPETNKYGSSPKYKTTQP